MQIVQTALRCKMWIGHGVVTIWQCEEGVHCMQAAEVILVVPVVEQQCYLCRNLRHRSQSV